MTTTRRGAAFLAVLAAGALTLSACGGSDDPEPEETDDPGSEETGDGTASGTITFAWEAEFTSYNGNSETGNGTWNTVVLNGVLSHFWDYAPEGGAVPVEEFGTYEKTSDDPLTVHYTYAEDAAWSDGEPIDCDDFLLSWAGHSGYFEHPTETNEDGTPAPLFQSPGSTGLNLTSIPECEAGAKEVDLVYSEPFADWEVATTTELPAHVAADQAGMTPEELIDAIRNEDVDALLPVAEFWNTGWDMNPGELPDPALIPSSGPYMIDSWDAGQSMTLKANPNWWGEPPATDTIVVRFVPGDQQVQALANGEVDVIAPQASVDLVSSLEALGDQVEIIAGDNLTWEHFDFNQNPGALFEDRNLREAFAKCVPRQQIVDNLIAPVNPEAVVMDLRELFPWDPDYDAVREAAVGDAYAEVDIAGATDLIAQSGVATPIDVRILRSDPNPRRADQIALVKASCDQAGFNIIDTPTQDLGAGIADPGGYDITMFAWAGSGLLTSGASLYKTNEGQNPYGYSNPDVDAAWDELVITLDEARQVELLTEIETLLWEDLFSVPVFAHPGITAHAPNIEGVQHNAAQTQVSFNMDEWSISE